MCPKNFPRYLQIKKCCKFCNVYSSSWSKKVIVKHVRALLTGLGDDAEAEGVKGRGIDLVPNLPDTGGQGNVKSVPSYTLLVLNPLVDVPVNTFFRPNSVFDPLPDILRQQFRTIIGIQQFDLLFPVIKAWPSVSVDSVS